MNPLYHAAEVPDNPFSVTWAVDSLHRAIAQSFLGAIAVGQLALGIAVSAADRAHWPAWLAAHAIVAVIGLAAAAGRVPVLLDVAALCALMIVLWVATDSIDSVLVLAATWSYNFSNVIPAMVLTGVQARIASGLIGLGLPLVIAVTHPDWIVGVAVPAFVTGGAIRWAARLAEPALRAFAERADHQTATAWQEQRSVAMERSTNEEMAESARTLHDTVVNTLSAVAVGGAAVRDVNLVRRLCQRDATTVRALLAGSTLAPDLRLEPLASDFGLQTRRSGLDDEALAQIAESLPVDVVRAMHGAAIETFRNVVKHSGELEVHITVLSVDGGITVGITDHGPGFDPKPVPGRGLAESITARCSNAGVSADVTTSRGFGTTVQLHWAWAASSGTAPVVEDFRATVRSLQVRACRLWAAAVVCVGIGIEAVNRFGRATPTYGMLLIAAATGLLVWRRGANLGVIGRLVVLVSVPVTFVLGFAGVGFGADRLILWQCLGPSVPLTVLMVQRRGRWLAVAGAVLLAAAAVGTAIAADAPLAGRASVVGTGAALPLLVLGAWTYFHRALETVGRRAAAAQADAEGARTERLLRITAANARDRWRDAGLHRCIAILDGLATGDLDPLDPQVRSACAEEEQFLRQVLLLDAELFRLGPRFAQTLAAARARGVGLSFRGAAYEVDEMTADCLADLVEEVVDGVPADNEVIVSLFVVDGRRRFAIVGPSPSVTEIASRWSAPAGWSSVVQQLASIDLVEVVDVNGSTR